MSIFRGTGGSIDGVVTTTTVPVAVSQGGTGATTATQATNNLLPAQATKAGQYLKTDGTNTSWDALDINSGDITGVLPVVNGGTGSTNASDALTALGAYAATNPAGYTTNIGTVTSVSGTAPISVDTGTTTPTISISEATESVAGSLSSADKTKLNGIEIGAQVNVGTDLTQGTRTTTAVPINSSTGTGATLGAATTSLAGVMSSTDKTKLDGIATGANNYTLPTATATVVGGVELFSNTVQSVAANAVTATASRTYGVQLNSNSQAVVNIPWTDTNSGGTVTSVSGTGTVSGLALSGTVTSTGNLTLGGTLAVTPSNFASQTANQLLIAPNGSAGVPTFRNLVAADVPTLNQNTTGTASNVTGTVAVSNGGTGATTAPNARVNLLPSYTGNSLKVLSVNALGTDVEWAASAGAGTVTSVAATGGTGISVTGSPITSSGTLTITNTAPDQTVALTGGTGISVTGTYPSFTVTNTQPSSGGTVTSVGGTGTVNGLSLSGTVTSTGNLTLGGTLSGVSLSTQVSGTLPIANGGTGATTRQNAMDALAGSVTSGQYLRGNGTDVLMSAIQAADVPTLNQSTTGSAATLTTGRTIAITGDLAYTSPSFNGSGNVTAAGTLATVNSNVGSFGSSTAIPVVTVNAKGLVTGVSTATVAGGQYFGSATVKAIAYNANTIGENVTVTTGNNGLSAGPITVSSGFTVTVQSGAAWVIV